MSPDSVGLANIEPTKSSAGFKLVKDITNHVNLLADRVHALRANQPRLLVALAGAPGSGKSTLAAELSRRLELQKCVNVVVPMDGFHLDNEVLDRHGLLARKGAPETFDAAGFIRIVNALRRKDNVIAPKFDRTRDIAIAGAIHIPPECPVVILEGNYLLLDEAPWSALRQAWDISAYLDVPMPEIRARLIQRWLSLNLSRAAATRRAESNDIPNAQRIVGASLPADFTLTSL